MRGFVHGGVIPAPGQFLEFHPAQHVDCVLFGGLLHNKFLAVAAVATSWQCGFFNHVHRGGVIKTFLITRHHHHQQQQHNTQQQHTTTRQKRQRQSTIDKQQPTNDTQTTQTPRAQTHRSTKQRTATTSTTIPATTWEEHPGRRHQLRTPRGGPRWTSGPRFPWRTPESATAIFSRRCERDNDGHFIQCLRPPRKSLRTPFHRVCALLSRDLTFLLTRASATLFLESGSASRIKVGWSSGHAPCS